jgi:hypothetical protein
VREVRGWADSIGSFACQVKPESGGQAALKACNHLHHDVLLLFSAALEWKVTPRRSLPALDFVEQLDKTLLFLHPNRLFKRVCLSLRVVGGFRGCFPLFSGRFRDGRARKARACGGRD